MKLQEVNEPEVLFTADDVGEHINYKNSSAHKYVLLKKTCKVVVTRNLYNGLVNGISGTVKEISGRFSKNSNRRGSAVQTQPQWKNFHCRQIHFHSKRQR